MLLGGVPGTRRGRVVILGGGVVGRNAATIAIGMGAQVTLFDAVKIANLGLEAAARQDPALALGINTYAGHITCAPVAEAHGLNYAPRISLLP